ncbi:MAG TPA: hypothetical protein H9866_00795 [Candidatus Tidjanibacter gallistercoris]|nr:hypothetical protein [Candidatus Tidjanibacter gallistercoris]
MKRKIVLLFVATVITVAAVGQHPIQQKPPRGRWGAEVNTYVLPFCFGAISADGIYNYAVADWFIVGAGAGLLLSDMEYDNDVSLVYGRIFVRLRFEVPRWKVSPVFFHDIGLGVRFSAKQYDDLLRPQGNTIIGVRFRLRNDDRITFGIGLQDIWCSSGCMPFALGPSVHFGYTF